MILKHKDNFTIALLSFAILMYQILVTRVLSVVLWYHWAFLAVSLAMLGLGVTGVWFALKPPGRKLLEPLLVCSALSIPASLLLIFNLGKFLALKYLLTLCLFSIFIPLILMGGAVCLLLLEARGTGFSERYGFDLLGACLGALCVIPLMHGIQTPALVVSVAFLPAAAWGIQGAGKAKYALVLAGLIGCLLIWKDPLTLRYSKSYSELIHRPFYEKWTPTARLTVFDSLFFEKNPDAAFGWGMGRAYQPAPKKQYWIEQDGSAGTPIISFKGTSRELDFLSFDVTSLVYQLQPAEKAAIIGPGGGRDILSAYQFGSREIHAIELNPHMIQTISRFKEFAGDVYHLKGVKAVASEGRSYLSRTRDTFDVIQISLIDSWAATAAGAYALSENNLYTREAFRAYLEKLNPHGILSVSRWMRKSMQMEAASLTVLAQSALAASGIPDAKGHFIAVRGGSILTALISREPFTAAQIEKLKALCAAKGFDLLFPVSEPSLSGNLVARVMTEGTGFLTSAGLRMRAATDDRPFFFQVLPVFSSVNRGDYGFNGASVYALRLVMLLVCVLAFLLFFLPLLLSAEGRRRHSGFWRGNFYFFCIGLSFMFIEMPWIQRFILYLGHPNHAMTTVLACLLCSAGLGSLVSGKTDLSHFQKWGFLLPLGLLGIDSGLSVLFHATMNQNFYLRVFLSWAVLFPAGFFMGFCFPLGVRAFGDQNKAWYWAVNGAAGVLASVLSLALAMEFGFSHVVWLGVLSYAAAWGVLRLAPKV